MNIIQDTELSSFSSGSLGDWTLWNLPASMNYISRSDASNVFEVQTYTEMEGKNADSKVSAYSIDAARLETDPGIRNKRIRDCMFNLANFQGLIVSVKLDKKQLDALKIDASIALEVKTTISLQGVSKTIRPTLLITRLQTGCLLINTQQPIVLSLADFRLFNEQEKANTTVFLAGKASSIPVTVNLYYLFKPV